MSRIAKYPVAVPEGVDVDVAANGAASKITVKGSKGTLSMDVSAEVDVRKEDGAIKFAPRSGSRADRSLAGTTRSLVNNMVTGVSVGFEKRLELVGVGYRAQARGQNRGIPSPGKGPE